MVPKRVFAQSMVPKRVLAQAKFPLPLAKRRATQGTEEQFEAAFQEEAHAGPIPEAADEAFQEEQEEAHAGPIPEADADAVAETETSWVVANSDPEQWLHISVAFMFANDVSLPAKVV